MHAGQQQMHGAAAAIVGQQRLDRRQLNIDKVEFVGKGKVFGQQAVGRVRGGLERDQRLAWLKADRRDGHLLQRQPAPRANAVDDLHAGAAHMQEQGVAQARAQGRLAVEKQAQRRHGQLAQVGQRAGGFDADADGGAEFAGQAQRWRRRQHGLIAHVKQAQRRHRHIPGRAELAGHALLLLRMHDGAAWNHDRPDIVMAIAVDAGYRT